jgi:hypothetical protein
MDRVQSKAFPDKSDFPVQIGRGVFGSVFGNDDSPSLKRFALKESNFGGVGAAEYAPIHKEQGLLARFSEICPEYTTATSTLMRVPTQEEKRRGNKYLSSNPHNDDDYTNHDYSMSDTALFMPRVTNGAHTAHYYISNNECSVYDSLVCAQQMFLVCLCVGDSMKFWDMHNENLMISRSVTYAVPDFTHKNVTLIERGPKITIIDTGQYKARSKGDMEREFTSNIEHIFWSMCSVLMVSNWRIILSRYGVKDVKSRDSYIDLLTLKPPTSAESHSERLLKYYQLFKDRILEPILKEMDTVVDIPNLHNPLVNAHQQHLGVEEIEFWKHFTKSNVAVTAQWKSHRVDVVNDLMHKIQYLMGMRVAQLETGEFKEAIPTWKLDLLMEKGGIKRRRIPTFTS